MKTNPIKTIAIVGSGNVGTHLGQVLKKAGFKITGVYSRKKEKAERLAGSLETLATDEIKKLPGADLVILAVPDNAISWVADRLVDKYRIKIHVSGSTSMNVLEPYGNSFGVIYPLQTFSVFREVDFSHVPVCVEGCCEEITQQLQNLAGHLTNDVRPMTSEQRLSVHLAAVFASNFVNYLNIEAADILQKAGVSRDILFPLMQETLNKMLAHHPLDAQTGPALRRDHGTMQKHIDKLSLYPDKENIYRILSEQIIRNFE